MTRRKMMSKCSKKRRGRPAERFAVFTSYGTHEHVECFAVTIQDGGIKSGGKVIDVRPFWSRDYPSLEAVVKSAIDWALARGAKKVNQIDAVFPLEECRDGTVRAMD
jgi:hypothetical protein